MEWLALPALVAAAGTIAVSHAEARYLLFSMVLATLIGAEAIGRGFDLLTEWSPAMRRQGTAPAGAAGLALGTAVVVILGVQVWRVRGDANGRWIADPARAIAMAADRPCVVATSIPPVVGWYSGCRAVTLEGTTPERLLAMQFASHWVVVTSADADRASHEARARFQALLRHQPIAQWEQGSAYGRAYQVDP